MTAKGIDRNSQTSLGAVNPKQGVLDNAILMEALDNADDIVRSKNYIIYFNHT